MQGNVNIPDSNITTNLTFRQLVLMNMQQLTNFPYIENDFDALTDYELLCLVVKFLNYVIANQNKQNTSITNMYNSFLALQTYVNNTKDTLEDAFNELDNYVRTFFENLDVQDEIDHKLNEMVEDGTLEHIIASYLQTQKIYNTHQEMIADASNLVSGLTVQTLGYYTINDGGGSFYKIVDSEPSTFNEDLGNDLYALLLLDNKINVKQLGIDDEHNNFSSLASLLSLNENVNIVEFNLTEYNVDIINTLTKDNLTIIGNGATIKPTNETGYKTIFNIISNESCTIRNITIDGSNMPQDQWAETSTSNLCIRKGFNISSKNIILENVNINNMWGEGVHFINYEKVDVSNCTMDNIGGGFYKTDASTGANDYFGDALYFSYHENNASIIINNCLINGYVETGDSLHRGSRSGVVLENITGTSIGNDVFTHISIQNTNLTNFNRAIHKESYGGDCTIDVTNCYIKQDCSISDVNNKTNLYIKESTIDHTIYNYGGSRGFKGFLLHANNCVINLGDTSQSALLQSNIAYYTDCTINNAQANAIFNGGTAYMKRCIFNMVNASTEYLIFSAKVYCDDCTFNNSTTDLKIFASSGSKFICSKCKFNDVLPYSDKSSVDNVLYSTSTTPTNTQLHNPDSCGLLKVYVNNVLISEPNICGILPATVEINSNTRTTSVPISSDPIPIIPATMPTNFIPKRNSKYLMIMVPCDADTYKYNADFRNCYYTTLKYDVNKNASYDGSTKIGSPESLGYNITVDTTNGTISKGASYSTYLNRIVYFILPMEYKDNIGTF